MGGEDSVAVQYALFLWFTAKHLAKEMFAMRLNNVKVLTASVIGLIGLPHAAVWYSSRSWYYLCAFGFYSCCCSTVLEAFNLCFRIAILHRLYFCCLAPHSD